MHMSVEQFLREVLELQDCTVIKKLSDCGQIIHLKKKEILYYQGYKPDSLAFLIDGIMRAFVFDEGGSDSTECFDYKLGWPVVPSIPMDAPASVNIEASVDSDLLLFPIADIMELIHTNVEITQLYNSMMCKSMQKYVQLTRAITQYTAAQRYEWFLSEYAALDGRVSHKDIASFLNMSPVTLSNVRKKSVINCTKK